MKIFLWQQEIPAEGRITKYAVKLLSRNLGLRKTLDYWLIQSLGYIFEQDTVYNILVM